MAAPTATRWLLVLLTVLLAATSCRTGEDLAADTVSLHLPDRRVVLDVDGCGRDGDVLVLGASSSSVLVQVLLRFDGDRVDLGSSGVTVTLGSRGTLGAGASDVIDAPAGAVGRIRSASLRGDRIDLEADLEPIGADTTLAAGRLDLAARCTADDGVAAGRPGG